MKNSCPKVFEKRTGTMNAHWLSVKRWIVAGMLASAWVGSTVGGSIHAAPPLDPEPAASPEPAANSVQTVILSLTGGGTAKLVIRALGSGMFLLQTQEGSLFTSPPTEPPEDGTPPVPPPRPDTSSDTPPTLESSSDDVAKGSDRVDVSVPENVPDAISIVAPAEVSSTEETAIVSESRDEDSQIEVSSESKTSESNREEMDLTQSPNLLPADRPDWIAKPVDIERSKHLISVDCDAAVTIEESKATRDESILREARKYVDKYVLKIDGAAEQLDRLNADWIRRHWLKKGKEFDAVLTTSSATYHQHWVQLEIDDRSRRIVENWWQDIVRVE